jgi:pyruvate dehydrogenase E2 component (dihydrolipoamide acetyltransferase)
MAIQVLMPKIGLTMTEGKIVEWRKKEGERVEKGEVLFVFETEKTTFEVEAPETGVLAKILATVEETVPVGAVVGLFIHKEGEPVEVLKGKAEVSLEGKEGQPKKVQVSRRIRATPLARKIAQEKGLDLENVPATGMGLRIRKVDVEKAIPNKPPEPVLAPKVESGKLVKLTGMRRMIAQKMLASKMETAQAYMASTVDAAKILESRETLGPVVEKRTGVHLTLTDILMKITATAVSLHPVLNTRWTPEGILWLDDIHLGMAMALEEGLIVPVIWGIGKKSLREIAQARAELVEKGKKGKLTPDDMKGSTFTFSSLGMYGVEEFSAIINQPESAVLGVGAILDKAVARNKEVVVRPMMKMTLSYDHRVIDGAKAAQFMKTLKELMEDPILILA